MIHPLSVNNFQQNHPLDLTDCLRIRELGLLRLVKLHGLFLQLLFQAILLGPGHPFPGHRLDGHGGQQQSIQLIVVPLISIPLISDTDIHCILGNIGDHLEDHVPHALAVQHPASLVIDDLSLLAHNPVILQQILSDAEVVALDFFLGRLNGIGQRLVFDLLSLGNTQCIKHANQPLGSKQPHQFILQRDIELGLARISLTAGTASELVVDTPGLMTLRSNDLKASRCSGLLIQFDIRTTARHVGSDCDRPVNTGVGYDLGLHLVELRIEHLVFYATPFQQAAQLFRSINIDGAHQHRLSFGMRLLHRRHDGTQFLFPCLIYTVLMIDTRNRFIGRNRHHVHAVDIAELLFLRQSRTGHTCFLPELVKKVLESDGGQGLALPLYLHPLLGLDGLVQAVGITPPGHDTTGKLIHNQHLVVLNHIVLVTEHQVVGPQSQNDIVLDLQILRVGIVVDMEELLHLRHAGGSQVDHFILFIYDEITCLLLDNAHQGIHLGQLLHIVAPLHLPGQHVAHFIQGRGLTALARDNQRCAGFIDQHRVHFIDDREMEPPQHQLLFVDHHIVTQIVKSQFIVGHIGNITAICFLPLLRRHAVQHHAHSQSQKLMDLAHPLRITLGQIIIDRHHMYALAFQGVQISRQQKGLGLTFAGLHLGNTALMHDYTANQLHSVVFRLQHSASCLSHQSICLGQNIVQGLAVFQPPLELLRLGLHLFVRQFHHLRTQGLDGIHYGQYTL